MKPFAQQFGQLFSYRIASTVRTQGRTSVRPKSTVMFCSRARPDRGRRCVQWGLDGCEHHPAL